MRSNAAHYDLIAPTSLQAVLATLAAEPGIYTPIAGGTELMVALGAGRLQARKLISLHHLKELRFIRVTPTTITLGAGTTFTDIRRHATIASDLPLLAQAASWTGSIANQNRGTLGGNLVNASPAADSPPPLLVYNATLTLISAQGTRTLPYCDFHFAYKKTALRPDELLHSITLPRDFSAYTSYIRKVGTRNAQAIAKIALAALARMESPETPESMESPENPASWERSERLESSANPASPVGSSASGRRIQQIRLAAASLRETPIRLTATEQVLTGQPITPQTIARARAALIAETLPIDDIRSTARYRSAIACNLLEEFLRSL